MCMSSSRAGALTPQGRWRRVKSRRYLFPVGVLSAIFRGKFLAGLTQLKANGALPAPPGGWPKLWKALGSTWNVYCKAPFAGPRQVLSYLSNYTHRVALSERRITQIDPHARTVTFRWRDYRERDPARARQEKTLPADEFLRRFRQHLLPAGFTKIRHYGLLGNNVRRKLIPLARAAIAATAKTKPPPAATHAMETARAAPLRACPHCGSLDVHFAGLVLPTGHRIPVRLPPAARVREPP